MRMPIRLANVDARFITIHRVCPVNTSDEKIRNTFLTIGNVSNSVESWRSVLHLTNLFLVFGRWLLVLNILDDNRIP